MMYHKARILATPSPNSPPTVVASLRGQSWSQHSVNYSVICSAALRDHCYADDTQTFLFKTYEAEPTLLSVIHSYHQKLDISKHTEPDNFTAAAVVPWQQNIQATARRMIIRSLNDYMNFTQSEKYYHILSSADLLLSCIFIFIQMYSPLHMPQSGLKPTITPLNSQKMKKRLSYSTSLNSAFINSHSNLYKLQSSYSHSTPG